MSNSGHTDLNCHPFKGQPWTIISIVLISVCFTFLSLHLLRSYCCGKQTHIDYQRYTNSWRYRLPGWPKEQLRGKPCVLFSWRLLNLCLAVSCIVYQYLPIHYYSADGKYNITAGSHSDVPHMYRFYTVWNFHLVFIYFVIGTFFSYQGMTATQQAEDIDQILIIPTNTEAHHNQSTGLPPRNASGCLERLHHTILSIELACTPLICLVVWTILFEGVDIEDGLPEGKVFVDNRRYTY